MFKSYTFTAPVAGKNILILGAVHGNETAGTIAQENIIRQIQSEAIQLKSGSVTFIPIVNQAAFQQDKRFIDVNLNRVIQLHLHPNNNEEKIANALLPFIDACDIMVDLHSTHCPDDVAFAFIDYPAPNNLELLSLAPVKTALAGWPQIYANQPDITNFCTEEYAYKNKKTAITVECGYHKANDSIYIATQTILNVLSYYGVIYKAIPEQHNPQVIRLTSYITKTKEGSLSRMYQHLDKITHGEVIATYTDGEQISAPFDGYIIMPNPHAEIDSEWFYFGQDTTE